MDTTNLIILEIYSIGILLGLIISFLFYYFLFNSKEF